MNENPAEERVEGERVVCRVKKSRACYDGLLSLDVYGEEGMAADGTYDGMSVVCDACYIALGAPSVGRGGDPGAMFGGRRR